MTTTNGMRLVTIKLGLVLIILRLVTIILRLVTIILRFVTIILGTNWMRLSHGRGRTKEELA